jgi:hypothetical protein
VTAKLCECGCGLELTGKQEKFATSQCRHRVIYHRHKDRHREARRARRREFRAAAILHAKGAALCPSLRRHGKCWIYPEGCAAAKASGRCVYRHAVPNVEAVLALPPGRVRTSPILRPTICDVCGVEFLGAKQARFCGNACRCKAYWIGRRERDGRKARVNRMPAERIEDGKRRCRWCQVEITGYAKRTTCSRRCVESVCDHNAGRSYSSTVMSVRL